MSTGFKILDREGDTYVYSPISPDEAGQRTGLSKIIRKCFPEYDVVEAMDGAEAEKVVSHRHVDILITDIQMPNLNGLELIERLSGKRAGMKVIILTGYAYFEYARQALRHGVFEYILKPYEQRSIVELLKKVEQKLEEENHRPTPPEKDERPPDGESVIEKCKRYIEMHYMEELSLEDIAHLFYFNPSYFSTFFKQHTGLAYSEYVTRTRLRRAKEELVRSDKRIQDIAQHVECVIGIQRIDT